MAGRVAGYIFAWTGRQTLCSHGSDRHVENAKLAI